MVFLPRLKHTSSLYSTFLCFTPSLIPRLKHNTGLKWPILCFNLPNGAGIGLKIKLATVVPEACAIAEAKAKNYISKFVANTTRIPTGAT